MNAALRAGHRVLIAEDDPAAAADMRATVESRGDTARVVGTVEEALVAMAEETFCYYLFDQQMPRNAGDEPMLGGGECLLSAAREKDARRNGHFHVTPIVVITSYSGHEDFVSKMYDLGASAFMSKPVRGNIEKLLDKIRVVLERGGRAAHKECAALAAAIAPPEGELRLVLDGWRKGRRTGVLVNGARHEIEDALFLVFFRLALARMQRGVAWSSTEALGFDRKPQVPSRIRKALQAAVPAGFEVLERDHAGGFRLNPKMVVERVEWEALERHPEMAVRRLAHEARERAGA